MSREYRYLSDEELNKLIENVEKEGLVKAPENIMSDVLDSISTENATRKVQNIADKNITQKNPTSKQKNKTLEFYKYTFKVVLAVAAALLLLTIIPNSLSDYNRVPTKEEVTDQDTVVLMNRDPVPTREETLDRKRKDYIIGNVENFIHEMGGKLR